METYYDKNYTEYQIFGNPDFINSQIWRIYYDLNYDLIYIFIAQIRHIRAKRHVIFNVEHKNMKS